MSVAKSILAGRRNRAKKEVRGEMALCKKSRIGRQAVASYWREFLFWVLLVPASDALGSASPRVEAAGLFEALCFFAVAGASLGKLKAVGLEFVEWNRVKWSAVAACVVAGLGAGAAIVGIAYLSGQPIGAQNGWNREVLAIALGPVTEEVIFRGYVLTAILHVLRCWPTPRVADTISVVFAAVVFSLAHTPTRGTTGLQLGCAVLTGCLYGSSRVRYRSTVAAVIVHGMYNLALYISCWFGLSRM